MENEPFWWPEANQAFIDAVRENINPEIPVLLIDNNVNDPPQFSEIAAMKMLELLREDQNEKDS